MLTDSLVRELRRLSHAEKLSAMQLLISELVSEEASLLREDIEYPIITPFGNEEAAKILLDYLEEEKSK